MRKPVVTVARENSLRLQKGETLRGTGTLPHLGDAGGILLFVFKALHQSQLKIPLCPPLLPSSTEGSEIFQETTSWSSRISAEVVAPRLWNDLPLRASFSISYSIFLKIWFRPTLSPLLPCRCTWDGANWMCNRVLFELYFILCLSEQHLGFGHLSL